jgi:hypothetical protein
MEKYHPHTKSLPKRNTHNFYNIIYLTISIILITYYIRYSTFLFNFQFNQHNIKVLNINIKLIS